MTEDENSSVIEDVAPPSESDQQQDDRHEDIQPTQARPISDQEYNWNEARRRLQELERRNQEQEILINRMQSSNQQPQTDDNELATLADDDIVTVGQFKTLAQKMARQVANEAIKENAASMVDERMKARFSDYEDVVTKDNFELLKQEHPELAMSIHSLSHDPYNQAVAAYKLLKKTGVGDMAKSQPQKARAIENSKKPVSVQAVTKSSAIGNVHNFENGLTPELRKQLQKEMQEARKAY